RRWLRAKRKAGPSYSKFFFHIASTLNATAFPSLHPLPTQSLQTARQIIFPRGFFPLVGLLRRVSATSPACLFAISADSFARLIS
ncbi:MAG: hypothetical protein ACKO81_09275, partial [Planctomycetota bacterium]